MNEETMSLPVNMPSEMNVIMWDDWHPIEDRTWPVPENGYVLAAYKTDGAVITINSSYVLANKRQFSRWKPQPALPSEPTEKEN